MLRIWRALMSVLRDPCWKDRQWLIWQLFPTDNPGTLAMRSFAMSIQAHALIETGWEDHVADYEARDLVLLRRFLGRGKGEAIMREAHRRARTRRERRLVKALHRLDRKGRG